MKKFTMKTEEIAEYLSVDPSFLKKNKNIHFVEGVHYTYPDKDHIKMMRWIVSAMELWMMGQSSNVEEEALIERLVS